MKKILYPIFLSAAAFCVTSKAYLQTFEQTSANDTIFTTPQALQFDITNPASGANAIVTLTVYYDGDFGASSETIDIYGENNTYIGTTVPNAGGTDCMADSTVMTFAGSYITLWAADDTIRFTGQTTPDVDYFCGNNHVRVKLTYNYCASGLSALLTMPQTVFCPLDPAVPLTISPAGGVLAGMGITGSTFSPEGLTPDSQYVISYTYTDANNCVSVDSSTIYISLAPDVTPVTDTVCPGATVLLSSYVEGEAFWFSDAALTQIVDSGATVTSPALSQTTAFYVSAGSLDDYFMITSLTASDSAIVDHDATTGDDRGGIAVTNNYVYVVGDDSTARYDLDLQNPVSYPSSDGIFSDLGNGQLYTLYNPVTGIPAQLDSMYVTHFYTLNADLTLGATSIALSDSIRFGYDIDGYNSGIFAGKGFVILYSSIDLSWLVVDLTTGLVIRLPHVSMPDLYGSENWAEWGIAEFDGNGYSVLHRNYNDPAINRYSILSGTDTVVAMFNDISDLSSFTYSEANNRWYFHYEGSGDFGGNDETLGYAAAGDSTGNEEILLFGCANSVTAVVGCLGVEEEKEALFSVYPNPSNGDFTVAMANASGDWNVTVTDISGMTVYQTRLMDGTTFAPVNLPNVASGLYFVTISNPQQARTLKVIVQH